MKPILVTAIYPDIAIVPFMLHGSNEVTYHCYVYTKSGVLAYVMNTYSKHGPGSLTLFKNMCIECRDKYIPYKEGAIIFDNPNPRSNSIQLTMEEFVLGLKHSKQNTNK